MKTIIQSILWIGTLMIMVSCNLTDQIFSIDEINTGSTEEIQPSDLPADIQASIQARFPNLTISDATKIISSSGDIFYAATLSDGVERTFGHDGGMCNAIDPADLSQAIIDAVSDLLPDSEILRAAERTNDDGETIYVLKLDTGEILVYSADGTLLADKSG